MKPGRLFIVAFLLPSLFCLCPEHRNPAARPAQVGRAGPTAPDSAAGTASDSYVIGPSDVLTVTVGRSRPFRAPFLSGLTA